MFDMWLEQLSTDELLAELANRFQSVVFAGLDEERQVACFVAGLKSECVFINELLKDYAKSRPVE